MSVSIFNFRIDTSRTSLAEKLDAIKAQCPPEMKDGKISNPDAAQGLADSVKQCIKDRVAELDATFDGALVVANGSQDTANGRITLTAQIYGKRGHA